MSDSITPAEWQIMKVIWTLKKATSSQVIAQLQDQWKPATIKTLLRRLVDKKILKIDKDNRAFVYSSCVYEQKMMDESAEDLFSQFCAMHTGQTLNELVKKVELSKHDIVQLQKILDQKMKTAPDLVSCNCLKEG